MKQVEQQLPEFIESIINKTNEEIRDWCLHRQQVSIDFGIEAEKTWHLDNLERLQILEQRRDFLFLQLRNIQFFTKDYLNS
jgi:hypothetical protein